LLTQFNHRYFIPCLLSFAVYQLLTVDSYSQKKDFSSVDKLIGNAISNRTFPSAVLLVGKDNDVIYQNSYGRLTYDDTSRPASMNTIYDLASVTKVIAATSAIMKLYDDGKIDLYSPVASYIPEFGNNGKEDITVFNLLVHNSGLTAWTPFYQTMSSADEVRNAVYTCMKEYPTGTQTLYSDYNAFLLGELVWRIRGKRLDKFCKENIFTPLGMKDTDFLVPMTEDYRIAPTEFDEYWRNQLLVGYVHDEFAAILEGVSGNAGLFSTAEDLFKFMKMMLSKGNYYNTNTRNLQTEIMFKPETVELFTTRVTGLGYNNTRALGWDTKPEPTKYPPQCGYKFSSNCFGHTGYTGTSVWCDTEKKLIIIFLTNRVYPKRGNEEIKNIRPKVHDEVCKVLGY